MTVGTVVLVLAAALFNYFVFLPLYAPALLTEGAGMYLLTVIIPFNFIKGVIISIITFCSTNLFRRFCINSSHNRGKATALPLFLCYFLICMTQHIDTLHNRRHIDFFV